MNYTFCFTKAFHCTKHQELINLTGRLIFDGKDLKVIRNLYLKEIAAVRWANELSEYTPFQRGLR